MNGSAARAPLVIGSVRLDNSVILAPMAGVSDMPFRRLVRRLGGGLVVSEMIASEAMIRAKRRTMRMCSSPAGEHPLAVQLVGSDPQSMAEAARLNADRGAAIIDINMGCPVRKVIRNDAGAALMRDEALAGAIMESVVKAVSLPVTLKMRTGWDETNRNAPRLARIAEEAGIAMVAVHGRTRSQLYSGRADWDFIARVKEKVRIPVVGNGDVRTVDDAVEMLERSGADGVMIGRGACGRPWFPGQVAHFLATGEHCPDPPLDRQLALLLDHFDDMIDHYGAVMAARLARKHFAWYTKGLPGSSEFRASLNRSEDVQRVRRMIMDFYGPAIERAAA